MLGFRTQIMRFPDERLTVIFLGNAAELNSQRLAEDVALVFLGDTLRINANAEGGTLRVVALNADGTEIEGFGHADSLPITSDNLRHIVKWQGKSDCRQLQGKPIRLQFCVDQAKLFSFEATTQH